MSLLWQSSNNAFFSCLTHKLNYYFRKKPLSYSFYHSSKTDKLSDLPAEQTAQISDSSKYCETFAFVYCFNCFQFLYVVRDTQKKGWLEKCLTKQPSLLFKHLHQNANESLGPL